MYKILSPKNIIKKTYFITEYLKTYMGDISQAVKLSIFLFVWILPYFLSKDKIVCLEILLGLLEGIILVVQKQKITFASVSLPRDLFQGVFTQKKPFLSIFPSARSHVKIFGDSFCSIFLYFLKATPYHLMKFLHRCLLYYSYNKSA